MRREKLPCFSDLPLLVSIKKVEKKFRFSQQICTLKPIRGYGPTLCGVWREKSMLMGEEFRRFCS